MEWLKSPIKEIHFIQQWMLVFLYGLCVVFFVCKLNNQDCEIKWNYMKHKKKQNNNNNNWDKRREIFDYAEIRSQP